MSDKFNKKPLATALGAVVVGSLSLCTANAAENPFEMNDLSAGYLMTAEKDMEGKCGEGKCGGSMKATEAEGKCAGKKAKAEGKCGEGKCGGDKAAKSEAKCGEGKCGEGKCGGKKAGNASVTDAADSAVKSAKDSVINSTVDSAADSVKSLMK